MALTFRNSTRLPRIVIINPHTGQGMTTVAASMEVVAALIWFLSSLPAQWVVTQFVRLYVKSRWMWDWQGWMVDLPFIWEGLGKIARLEFV